MSEQRHVIKKQILEIQMTNELQAQDFHSEVSRIYRQRIVPLLEQYCSELSDSNQIYRIEHLEIDVGQISLRQFEQEFVRKVSSVLYTQLRDVMQQQSQQVASHSHLELLAFFAQTGSVPWWADSGNLNLLAESMQQALHTTPDALEQWLSSLDKQAWQRLVLHFSDAQLTDLLALLVPPVAVRDLFNLINDLQHDKARQIVWTIFLQASVEHSPSYPVDAAFYSTVLNKIAVDMHLPYPLLLTQIQKHEDSYSFTKLDLQPLPLAEYLSELEAADDDLHDVWLVLRRLAASLASAQQKQLLISLQNLQAGGILNHQNLITVLQTVLTTQRLAPAIIQSWSQAFATVNHPVAQAIATLLQQVDILPHTDNAPDMRFSASDDLHVNNAGLVILWHFLPHLFGRLGLLQERNFIDNMAQQRAVAFLQYLATGQTDFAEYLLPLNKMLCGMEITDLFDFSDILSQVEMEECDNLLLAVIEQATILRSMSPIGLRGTFLLRHGKLSSRDGMWLLQVERETYDVVLERFPWGWQWVKLPWMKTALRVEW